MLGIIELVRNEFEQAARARCARRRFDRSPRKPAKRDFRDAVPNPRHRLWAWLAAVPLAVAVVAVRAVSRGGDERLGAVHRPLAADPALHVHRARRACPSGSSCPRRAGDDSGAACWRNRAGSRRRAPAQLGSQPPVTAELARRRYEFALPPQIDAEPAATSASATRDSESTSSRCCGPS